MTKQEIYEKLVGIVGEGDVIKNEPMSKHTTFKIGGAALLFVQPRTEQEIAEIIKLVNEENINYEVVGNGSNLLVSDDGFDGVIINITSNYAGFTYTEHDKFFVQVKAGTMLGKLGNELCRLGVTGFEFATGIPGTIGGAIMMNAGAYGGEMKDIVFKVRVCDRDGNIFDVDNMTMGFGYRTSVVKDNGWVVLETVLALDKGDVEEISATLSDLAARRRDKQPLEYPSAGSTFKRPEGNFAGKLIEDAGLKGRSVGGACVSEKHAGFVVNKGNATAKDIIELTDLVKEAVKEQSGVELELEIRKIGF